MLKDNCFPKGADDYDVKKSSCYATCKKSFGETFFEGNGASPEIKQIYQKYGLPLSAKCGDITSKQASVLRDNYTKQPNGDPQKKQKERDQSDKDFEVIKAHAGCNQ